MTLSGNHLFYGKIACMVLLVCGTFISVFGQDTAAPLKPGDIPDSILRSPAPVTTPHSPTQATKYTISGYVKDKSNGESMLAATVYAKEAAKGLATNNYGFYSLTLPAGKYTLTFSFLGYETQSQTVNLNKDTRLNIDLSAATHLTEEVVVQGERKDKNVESTDIAKIEMKTEDIKSLPALLGEVDVMKALQLLPGVQSAGEGNMGLYVRGGGPDQNLVLLDNAVVYNPGHLFGFFSVFNSDAVKSTTLYKGGVPAEYGGRISAVVDVDMKEGNTNNYQFDGGIGLIASRLTIQGPIKKKKSSFIISGRRTYLDLLSKPFLAKYKDGKYAGNSYYFYDINAKVNYEISDKDHLYLSGYFGRDVFAFKDPSAGFNANIAWGNATATARWNHLFNQKLFMNVTALYNEYDFGITTSFQGVDFGVSSGVRDFGGKVDFDYFPDANHTIKFGTDYTYHIFSPYSAQGDFGSDFTTDITKKRAHETGVYFQDDWSISSKWKLSYGLRASLFNDVGPQQKKVFNDLGQPIDTLVYKPWQNIATYWGLEPRISVRFRIDEESSIKAAVTVSNQYIHLVSSSTSTLPTDLWVPSTPLVKPEIGIQYEAGYFHNFLKNMFESSVEVYYKDLRNQIEYADTYTPSLNRDVEDGFVFGRGYSYGAEFFFKKTLGKLTGWIGYTLSRTMRIFPDIDNGVPFPSKYDRTHDLSVVVEYEFQNKKIEKPRVKWKASAIFVYGSGQTTTLPIDRYFIGGNIANKYGDRNNYRMAPYDRLDLGITMIFLRKKHYNDLTFSVYNVYNRQNPYFLYNDIQGSVAANNLTIQAKQASLFPILPSITWNFKF